MSTPLTCKSCGTNHTDKICDECGEAFCNDCISGNKCPECGSLNLSNHDSDEDLKPPYGDLRTDSDPTLIWRKQ